VEGGRVRLPRPRGKELAVLLGGAAVAFVAGLFVLNALIGFLLGHGDEVEVPALAGLSVDEARERLRAVELTLVIKSERPSNAFDAGQIVSQFPKPLARVKPARRIEVIVSTGIEQVVMPHLQGLSISDAKLRLADAGLRPGEILAAPARGPRNAVIATTPAAGGAVPRDTEVDLLVSAGPDRAEYVMPELVGRNVDDVVRTLVEAGLQIGEIVEREAEEERGTVIMQAPAPGAFAAAGDSVHLVVAGSR
jgi:serine/threonine-protein kinase